MAGRDVDPAYLQRIEQHNDPNLPPPAPAPDQQRAYQHPFQQSPYAAAPAPYPASPYAAYPAAPQPYAAPHQQQPYPPHQQPYPPAAFHQQQQQPYPAAPQPYPHQQQHQQQPYPPYPATPATPYAAAMTSAFRPTGRRRALLVGINYKGTKAQLRGCVRDVTFVHHLLTSKFGFRSKDMVVLTDEPTAIHGARKGQPTKKTILDSLRWLVAESRPGDSLWFSFSGHGSQVRDSSGDESDGYDETILPVNYKSAGHIVDDDLYDIVRRVSPASRLTVLLDACHSGTGLDLPYQHDVFGTGSGQKVSSGRPPSLTAGLFNAAGALLAGNGTSAIQSGLSAFGVGRRKKRPQPGPDPNAGEVLLFSGCKDNQTSADTSKLTGGLTTGAMTYALIETLEHSTVGDWRNYNYRQLLQTMRQKLRAAKMSQTPQFSTSHPFDLSSPFIL